MSHTPTPWVLWKSAVDRKTYVLDYRPDEKPFTGQVVAIETTCPDSVENLAMIVRAVNSHAALVEALVHCHDWILSHQTAALEGEPVRLEARAAFAAAGEAPCS